VQDTVNKAANKCRNASVVETAAAVGDNISISSNSFNSDNAEAAVIAGVIRIGADFAAYMTTRNATKDFRTAKGAVESLQEKVQEALPQVHGAFADNVSESNSTTLMMDTFGGILATLSNWDTATQLHDAKNHLHDVSNQLGDTISRLSRNKQVIAEAALTEARKSDSPVAKFAAELESSVATGTVKPKPQLVM
jgi:hypothetical protein